MRTKSVAFLRQYDYQPDFEQKAIKLVLMKVALCASGEVGVS